MKEKNFKIYQHTIEVTLFNGDILIMTTQLGNLNNKIQEIKKEYTQIKEIKIKYNSYERGNLN